MKDKHVDKLGNCFMNQVEVSSESHEKKVLEVSKKTLEIIEEDWFSASMVGIAQGVFINNLKLSRKFGIPVDVCVKIQQEFCNLFSKSLQKLQDSLESDSINFKNETADFCGYFIECLEGMEGLENKNEES